MSFPPRATHDKSTLSEAEGATHIRVSSDACTSGAPTSAQMAGSKVSCIFRPRRERRAASKSHTQVSLVPINLTRCAMATN